MTMHLPCPECGTHLEQGILRPCPQCGWQAGPEAIQAWAMQTARLVGRLHGSRIAAWFLASASMLLNLVLLAVVVILIV